MILPEYQLQKCTDHELEVICFFHSDYPYFEGHFPNLPILAGVVQLGLVYEFIQQYWRQDIRLNPIKQVKYQKLLFPENTLVLQVKKETNKKRITFEYRCGDTTISSGIFSL
ncbi:hypothetical protein [Pasteurella dagmatis]|uniref:FabA-like domain protein n=1 Tax=Pasteurella dagmatis ATCC 43325 TaxID=667128 RepID=C9PNT9_9PAST|nr:hypothetical protein [Pasteurella dagmatis]EEX50730.1 FabA-like domain protein [Pasteurella dagmatis ATCC 43325]SNV78012.1 Uncharacterised protein [Pasteurella dagmatis]